MIMSDDVQGTKAALKRVCIIGAGFAGIANLRALTRKGDVCDVTVFEKNPDVGGVWYHAKNEGVKGGPGFIYEGLRTNTPRQCWEFRDMPQPDDAPTYLRPMDINAYIMRYVDTYSLRKYIQFESIVDSVKKGDEDKWSVTVTSNNVQRTLTFDYVILCIGMNRSVYVPTFPGIDTFEGSKIHSGNFRVADEYSGRNVLIVGTRASMFDICLIVAKVAKKVFVSGRTPHPIILPENTSDRPAVASFTEHEAVFVDGTKAEVDDIIFCTGYGDFTTIPFVDPACGLSKKNDYVYPLYNNIVNVNNPTMLVCGLFDYHWILPLFEFLADYVETIVAGKTILPSKQDMLDDIENEFKKFEREDDPPYLPIYSLLLPARQEKLHAKLSKEAGIKGPDPYCYSVGKHLYYTVFVDKRFHLYRKETYHKTSSGELEVVFHE